MGREFIITLQAYLGPITHLFHITVYLLYFYLVNDLFLRSIVNNYKIEVIFFCCDPALSNTRLIDIICILYENFH